MDTCFTVVFFGMNWISQSFSIPNFINSRSQMFSQINVLKKYTKCRGKLLYRNLFQASNVLLLRKRYQHSCIHVSFAKLLRISFFLSYKTSSPDCFCNLDVVKVWFLIYCTLFTNLDFFHQLPLPKIIQCLFDVT